MQGPNKNLPTDDESSETQTEARETREMSGCDSSLLNDFLSVDDSWELVVPKKPAPKKAIIYIGNLSLGISGEKNPKIHCEEIS